MSFVSNKYEQLGFKDSLIPLSDRERKILETSWASAFVAPMTAAFAAL